MWHFRASHFAAKHFAAGHLRGLVGGNVDTHDNFGYWEKYWANLHKKKKAEPTIEEIVEAVQENPIRALQAVPEARAKFKEVDYSAVKQNADLALFIAQELMITLELRRIEDENDENDAIMLLLM